MTITTIRQLIPSPLWSDTFLEKVVASLDILRHLGKNKQFQISFSGGKDSHALLALWLLAKKLGIWLPPVTVVFADTGLEHQPLIKQVDIIFAFCQEQRITAEKRVSPKSFWHYLLVFGYPVPDHRIRWCTGKLKTDLIDEKSRVSLTGAHYGESSHRDQQLKKRACGGDSCGTDKIVSRIDPIFRWDNDDVWSFLLITDGYLFPEGTFNNLNNIYETTVPNEKGSLRMGCVMCPVIAKNTAYQNFKSGLIDEKVLETRLFIEQLREGKRINNPKKRKDGKHTKGSIHIEERRKFWLNFGYSGCKKHFLWNRWISLEDCRLIDKALQSDYSYPPTYSREWIDSEHERIKSLPTITQLSLF